MYTIPKEKVQEVTVIKSSLIIRISTTRTVTSTSLFVNWDVKVSNKDDEAIEIDNNNIEIYRTDINMAENEKVTIPNATVAAKAVEQSIGSGTIEMNHENFMKMTEAERKTVELWALVTLQSGTYQANQQVLMDLSPAPKTL
jgi:LEA14-like dessication related protein